MYNHIFDPQADSQNMYNLCNSLLAAICWLRIDTPTQGTTYVGQQVAMVLVALEPVENDEQAALYPVGQIPGE